MYDEKYFTFYGENFPGNENFPGTTNKWEG